MEYYSAIKKKKKANHNTTTWMDFKCIMLTRNWGTLIHREILSFCESQIQLYHSFKYSLSLFQATLTVQ